MQHLPTLEQTNIITLPYPEKDQTIVVKAFAGTGKTSTMEILGRTKPDKTFLYLVFTKANKEEARRKMPSNVTVENFHSVAYKHYPEYANRVFRHKPSFQEITSKLARQNVRVQARAVALGMRLYETWSQSSDQEITASLLPFVFPPPSFLNAARSAAGMCGTKERARHAYETKMRALFREHGEAAIKVACGLRRIHSMPEENIPDDFYLKRFQLDKIQLNYDYVVLDEAQDTNDVCEAIFLQQENAARILVGDPHQSIYHWRGAVDAISKLERKASESKNPPLVFTLSQSFRFGTEIAKAADFFLKKYKKEKTELRGTPAIKGEIKIHNKSVEKNVEKGEKATILFRTNREALNTAMDLVTQGHKVGFLGGIDNYGYPEIEDIQKLSKGMDSQKLRTATIKQFKNLEDLKENNRITGDKQLERYTELALERWEDVKKLKAGTTDERTCDILITTAHRSKGLEWDIVVIADDFTSPMLEAEPAALQTAGLLKGTHGDCIIKCLALESDPSLDEDGNARLFRRKQLLIEEANLLYVAATRAVRELRLPNLLAQPFGIKPLSPMPNANKSLTIGRR